MKKLKISQFVLLSFLLFYSCSAKTEPPIIDIINSDNNEIVSSIISKTTSKFVVVLRENLTQPVPPPAELKNKTYTEKLYLSEVEKYNNSCYIIFSGKNDGKTPYKFTIMGHNPRKSFFLDVFVYNEKTNKLDATYSNVINILAAEPTTQASNIGFSNIKYNSINITCQDGNGKGRILIASTDSSIETPKRGVFYKSGEFGKPGSHKIGKNSYVVYNSLENPKDKFAKLVNLSGGTYYFAAYEFNGEGNNTNYNYSLENKNKVSYMLPLKPPITKPATNITKDGFYMNWSAITDVETYELTLSIDKDFINIDEVFNSADVGNVTEYPFEQLEVGKTYYCKVRAKLKDGRFTDFSEPVKIQLLSK